MTTMTMLLVIAMIAAIVMLIARCGCWIRDCELLVLLLGIVVVCCCFVCGAQCDVCGIEGGASSHACCGRGGYTPIHVLAEGGGHLSCLELLLTRNADVNAETK